MTGVNNQTGELIEEDWEHCKQSIIDILTTPIGTRILRRDYGCNIHELIDRPQTQSVFLDCLIAVADALHRWEPRFELNKFTVNPSPSGVAEIGLFGYYRPQNLKREVVVTL